MFELWVLSLSIGAVLYTLTLLMFGVVAKALRLLDEMLDGDWNFDAELNSASDVTRPSRPSIGEHEWDGTQWLERPGGEYEWNRLINRWEPTRYDETQR